MLVARSEQRRRETAARLHEAHGVRVEVIAEDLSREHAAQTATATRLLPRSTVLRLAERATRDIAGT